MFEIFPLTIKFHKSLFFSFEGVLSLVKVFSTASNHFREACSSPETEIVLYSRKYVGVLQTLRYWGGF